LKNKAKQKEKDGGDLISQVSYLKEVVRSN